MSVIEIVVWVIKNAPALIGLIKQVLDLFHSMPHQAEAGKRALSAAINTGNADLVKATCESLVGCASQPIHDNPHI